MIRALLIYFFKLFNFFKKVLKLTHLINLTETTIIILMCTVFIMLLCGESALFLKKGGKYSYLRVHQFPFISPSSFGRVLKKVLVLSAGTIAKKKKGGGGEGPCIQLDNLSCCIIEIFQLEKVKNLVPGKDFLNQSKYILLCHFWEHRNKHT